jgi:hypothetical protein
MSIAPYGYTLTVWTSGAVLTHARGIPTTVDALLFMLGAVFGFALVGGAAFGRLSARAVEAPQPALWAGFQRALDRRSDRSSDADRAPVRGPWRLAARRLRRHDELPACARGPTRGRELVEPTRCRQGSALTLSGGRSPGFRPSRRLRLVCGAFLRETVSRRLGRMVSGGVARCRGASRVPDMYPRCTRVLRIQATQDVYLQAIYRSYLTDSSFSGSSPPLSALLSEVTGAERSRPLERQSTCLHHRRAEPLPVFYALLATDGRPFAGLADGQLWESRDRGDSWTALRLQGDALRALLALAGARS